MQVLDRITWSLIEETKGVSVALDILYDNIDDMLLAGKFQQIDSYLTEIHIPGLSKHILLGILTITFAAKTRLLAREAFFFKVKDELTKRNETNVGELLQGLQ